MSLSPARAQRELQRGASKVLAALDEAAFSLPDELAERVRAVRSGLDEILWTESVHGDIHRLTDDQEDSGIWVVLLPDRELAHAGRGETFHTNNYGDGSAVRVHVRAVPLTPEWAGLGLLHELSHAHDFRSGIEPSSPSHDEYLAGEARAFRMEAVLLNALSGGRLATALRDRLDPETLTIPDLTREPGRELAATLETSTLGPRRRPPASDNERGLREAAFLIAALFAVFFAEPDPLAIEEPEGAATASGQFFDTFTATREQP